MVNDRLLIIDRFVGGQVVIEYEGSTINLPRELVPPHAKEGDVLQIQITVDVDATTGRRERIRKLTTELFEE